MLYYQYLSDSRVLRLSNTKPHSSFKEFVPGIYSGASCFQYSSAQTVEIFGDTPLILPENVSGLLYRLTGLTNLDVSNWDTSNVKNMSYMFSFSSISSLDMSSWNVSNVTDMSYMFADCIGLQEIYASQWSTNSLQNVSYMFQNCRILSTSNIGNWSVSQITDTSHMFENCTQLYAVDLHNWKIDNLIQCRNMFCGCNSLKYIEVDADKDWRTHSTLDGDGMFIECDALPNYDGTDNLSKAYIGDEGYFSKMNPSHLYYNYDSYNGVVTFSNSKSYGYNEFIPEVSSGEYNSAQYAYFTPSIDTDSIILPSDVSGLFSGCYNIANINMSKCEASYLTKTKDMFAGCSNLVHIDTPNWTMNNVTSTSGMFNGCSKLSNIDMSNWSLSEVADTSWMFGECSLLSDIDTSNWKLEKVTSAERMFSGCNSLNEIDASEWDMSDATSTREMFYGCNNLQNIYAKTATNWNNGFVDGTDMFNGCSKLPNFDGTTGVSKAYEGVGGYFTNSDTIKLFFWYDISNKTLHFSNSRLNTNYSKYISGEDGSHKQYHNATSVITEDDTLLLPENCSYLLNELEYLKILDVSKWDISNVKNMYYMFTNCTELSQIVCNRGTNWNNGFVELSDLMFANCPELPGYNHSNTDIQFAIDRETYSYGYFNSQVMWYFYDTDSSTVYFSNRKVNEHYSVWIPGTEGSSVNYRNARNVVTDESLQLVPNVSGMFYKCKYIENIDTSKWTMSYVLNAQYMFSSCEKLVELNLNNKISNVMSKASSMFENCTNLKMLHIHNASFTMVDITKMFADCKNLEYIDVEPGADWTSRSTGSSVFNGCTSLLNYQSSKIGNNMAKDMIAYGVGYFNAREWIASSNQYVYKNNKWNNCVDLLSYKYDEWKNVINKYLYIFQAENYSNFGVLLQKFMSVIQAITNQSNVSTKILSSKTYSITGLNILSNRIYGSDNTTPTFTCYGNSNIASTPNEIVFENINIDFGFTSYHGFWDPGNITFNNCNIKGLFFGYNNLTFNNCTFDLEREEYCTWTYTGNMTFNDCIFNSHGKIINVYNEGSSNTYTIEFNRCVFKSDVVNKAAINIKETSGSNLLNFNVSINDCVADNNFPESSTSDTKIVFNHIVQVDDRAHLSYLSSSGITIRMNGNVIYQTKAEVIT